MSGGYVGKPPTDLAGLMQQLKKLQDQVKSLQNGRATAPAAAAGNVIMVDADGVRWRLGVTTSGATTWTQV